MDSANETGGDRCYILVVLQQQAIAVVVMETAAVVLQKAVVTPTAIKISLSLISCSARACSRGGSGLTPRHTNFEQNTALAQARALLQWFHIWLNFMLAQEFSGFLFYKAST